MTLWPFLRQRLRDLAGTVESGHLGGSWPTSLEYAPRSTVVGGFEPQPLAIWNAGRDNCYRFRSLQDSSSPGRLREAAAFALPPASQTAHARRSRAARARC